MNIENIAIKDIKPYERNAKKHDERQIKNVMQSIKNYGIVQPLVVDKDNVLIIGHCRLIAAKRLKLKEVPVVRMDELTQEQVNKLRLLDNKLNESEWDFDLLAEDIPTLDFSDFDIDWDLPEDILEKNTEIEEDEAPEPPAEPKAKLGDLYILGNHRLICGDSTDVTVIDRLMDGVKADMWLSDPPYNVEIVGGSHAISASERKKQGKLTIQNDHMESDEFKDFLKNAFTTAYTALKGGASFYIWYASREVVNFQKSLEESGFLVKQELIWNKNSLVMGRQDYQWKHEPCLYGWKDGNSHNWYGDRKQTTIIDFERPTKSDLHPTMKPIGLLAIQIENSSKVDDIVFDGFGGSGSTLIACEQLNRKCYMCELDPKYVSVIVNRWLNFTGRKDEIFCIRDGQKLTYDEVFGE